MIAEINRPSFSSWLALLAVVTGTPIFSPVSIWAAASHRRPGNIPGVKAGSFVCESRKSLTRANLIVAETRNTRHLLDNPVGLKGTASSSACGHPFLPGVGDLRISEIHLFNPLAAEGWRGRTDTRLSFSIPGIRWQAACISVFSYEPSPLLIVAAVPRSRIFSPGARPSFQRGEVRGDVPRFPVRQSQVRHLRRRVVNERRVAAPSRKSSRASPCSRRASARGPYHSCCREAPGPSSASPIEWQARHPTDSTSSFPFAAFPPRRMPRVRS